MAEIHGQETLGEIKRSRDNSRPQSQDFIRIKSTSIPCSVLPKVNPFEQLSEKIRWRNGAEKIASN